MKICFVTDTYTGADALGDLGSGFQSVAELYSDLSHDVTILVCDFTEESPKMKRSPDNAAGHRLVFLSEILCVDRTMSWPVLAASKAYAVYRYLSKTDFDVTHFIDRGGLGFYASLAKAQGSIPTLIVTHVTGPTHWRRHLTFDLPDIESLETETLEKIQFENSDLAITSTGNAVDRVKELGWKMPPLRRLDRLPLISRLKDVRETLVTRAVEAGQINELVFFGSQDRSNGFELFIEIARQITDLRRLDLTVIGPWTRNAGELSASRLLRMLVGYPGRIRFLNDIGYNYALSWLASRANALCILPASDRISSAGIDECFAVGIPFIASDLAGARELVDVSSRRACLVPPTASDFARAIKQAVEDGMPTLQSTLEPRRIAEEWDALCSRGSSETICDQLVDEPLVSVCIAHHDRPQLLRRAIDYLMGQTYKNIEIVIVDDGSRKPETIKVLGEIERQAYRFPLIVVHSENRYLGAARNLAARHARGEFLLFHDDDNYAEPNEVEIFVRAALRTRCEILTSQCWIVRDECNGDRKIENFFLGVGGAYSFLQNRFGDANALVRRETFKSLGGFTEIRNVGLEDWEFFLRAHLRGIKMAVVPEPLFNYRINSESMLQTGDILRNRARIFAAMEAECAAADPDLARLASKPIVETEIRGQLLSLFGRIPEGELHAELLDLHPTSDQTIAKLATLAQLTAQRAGLGVPTAELLVKDTPDDIPVLLLSGWAFLEKTGPYVPKLLSIDNKLYQTFDFIPVFRHDVNIQFRLSEHDEVGFLAFVRPFSGLTWFRRRRAIATSLKYQLAILDSTPKRLRAHIDSLEPYRVTPLELPGPNWSGSLTLETESKSLCALKSASRLILPSPLQAAFRHRFLPQASMDVCLAAIVPAIGEIKARFD